MKTKIQAVSALLFLFFFSALFSNAYGEQCSIALDTDKDQYSVSERVFIFGAITEGCQERAGVDYALEVRQGGRIFFADQKKTDANGNFFVSFVAGDYPKEYTIIVSSIEAKASKTIATAENYERITVETLDSEYYKGEMAKIKGQVKGDEIPEKVAIIVKDEKGNIVFADEADVSVDEDGIFYKQFRVLPAMETGIYAVFAADEEEIAEAEFMIYPGIVINEIMPYPENDDSNKEFIELYNPSEKDVNICGWTIRDKDGNTETFECEEGEQLFLEKGMFAVIASTDNSVEVFDNAVFWDAGDMIFNGIANDRGMIILSDKQGNAIDSFSYRQGLCSDRDSDGNLDCSGEGASIERIDAFELTNLYSNWDSGVFGGTPGVSNSILSEDIEELDFEVLYFDTPTYATEGEKITTMLRISNNADSYRLFEADYEIEGNQYHSAKIIGPNEISDVPYSLMPGTVGEHTLRATVYCSGCEDVVVQTADILVSLKNDEGFRADILVPALVPRGGEFEALAVLRNELEYDIEDITVRIAAPQAGGFDVLGASEASISAIDGGAFDSSVSFRIKAAVDTSDEMLGTRTFSLFASGVAQGSAVDDTSFAVTEIIGHSSPVISVDLNAPERIETGKTYRIFGAAFNTGTEDAKNAIITLNGEGIDVVSESAFFFETISSGDVMFFEAEIEATDELEEYILYATIKDDTQELVHTEYIGGYADTEEIYIETSGLEQGSTGGTAPSVTNNANGNTNVNTFVSATDDQEPNDSADDSLETNEVGDDSPENQANDGGETAGFDAYSSGDDADIKADTPTGRIIGALGAPAYGIAILVLVICGFVAITKMKKFR